MTLVAFIRSLAELRGRNADWAEKAVREAATLSANAALEARVIDLVARDTTELLRKIDGRTVEVARRQAALWRRTGCRSKRSSPAGSSELLVGHHRSERRAHPDARRHLRPDLRIFEPRRRRARRDRHDLPAARALRPQHAADRLYRPRPDAARASPSWLSRLSTRPWSLGLAGSPPFFWGRPCCSRSRLPATRCRGPSSASPPP